MTMEQTIELIEIIKWPITILIIALIVKYTK